MKTAPVLAESRHQGGGKERAAGIGTIVSFYFFLSISISL
jgi:hypothetical protein